MRLQFEQRIYSWQLESLRREVIRLVGPEQDLYHNHRIDASGESKGFYYRYPLIQYKKIGHQASMVGIGAGADALHSLLTLADKRVHIEGWEEAQDLRIDKIRASTASLRISLDFYRYRIPNWVALNARNFARYREIEGLSARIAFLEKLMQDQMLSLAKGLGFWLQDPVQVRILQLRRERLVHIKKQPFLAFDLDFSTNLRLPLYLGLGGKVSKGFGTILPASRPQEKRPRLLLARSEGRQS